MAKTHDESTMTFQPLISLENLSTVKRDFSENWFRFRCRHYFRCRLPLWNDAALRRPPRHRRCLERQKFVWWKIHNFTVDSRLFFVECTNRYLILSRSYKKPVPDEEAASSLSRSKAAFLVFSKLLPVVITLSLLLLLLTFDDSSLPCLFFFFFFDLAFFSVYLRFQKRTLDNYSCKIV